MKTGPSNDSLRILCISPVFVPTADPEAFCGAKMVQSLMECGAAVTVLASSNFRERPYDGSSLWHSLKDAIVDVPVPRSANRLHSIVAATEFQTPFDARWVKAAVRKAKLLHSERGFDLIYTRSLPIAAHIVGYWFARAVRLPWIANINDPWTSEFFPVEEGPKLSAFWTAANMFWLRRTLLNADLMTYPCRRLKDFHLRLAKLDLAAEVIPHIGYKPKSVGKSSEGHFRLVHAGRLLASEGRFGKAILLGLKAFLDSYTEAAADTKLILVGPGDDETQSLICELGLQRNIEIVGRVNYENSLDYIASSSACVLIESRVDEGIFFASKLADYLAHGKPVLAVSPSIGTAADLADRGELIRVDYEPESIKNAIAVLYAEFKRGTLSSRSPSDQLQAQLQGHNVANKFLAACEILTSEQSDGRGARMERIKKQWPLSEQSF
jgi:glycosyltransferase involved in cell wall biosynthesis